MAKVGDILIVPAGNEKNLHNMDDIAAADGSLVTGAGYNSIKVAKAAGVETIMEVPGPTEILAAVRAGRADAGAVTYFTGANLVAGLDDVELSDASKQPVDGANWVGIGFAQDDTEFLAAFNAAQAEYLGSDAMLASVAEYGSIGIMVRGVPRELTVLEFPGGSEKIISLGCLASCLT